MMEQSRLVVLNDEQWAVLGPLIDECRPQGRGAWQSVGDVQATIAGAGT